MKTTLFIPLILLASLNLAIAQSTGDNISEPRWMGKTIASDTGLRVGATCLESSTESTGGLNGCLKAQIRRWSGHNAQDIGRPIDFRTLPNDVSLEMMFNTNCPHTSKRVMKEVIGVFREVGGESKLSQRKFTEAVNCFQSLLGGWPNEGVVSNSDGSVTIRRPKFYHNGKAESICFNMFQGLEAVCKVNGFSNYIDYKNKDIRTGQCVALGAEGDFRRLDKTRFDLTVGDAIPAIDWVTCK